jgi:arsenate reductase
MEKLLKKPKVLFYCRDNSIRSQMAEAMLRDYAGNWVDVYSAGLELHEIHPYTYQAMAEMDIDMRGQRTKPLWQYYVGYHFKTIINLCDNGEGYIPNSIGICDETIRWFVKNPLDHPTGAPDMLNQFRAVRDTLDLLVRGWIEKNKLPVAPFGYPWLCMDETTPLEPELDYISL